MSLRRDDFNENEDAISNPEEGRYCENCKWLTEAVRDFEQQRREAMDQYSHDMVLLSKFSGDLGRSEELFLSKMRTLEHRRDAALDVLAKHQQLEHQ
jgi:hypothetical protein